MSKTISIDVKKDLFGANAEVAAENAARFGKYGIRVYDVMGSVGTGKTMLIESICQRLKDRYSILMVAGDLETRIDADRVSSHGIDTVQINTKTACHLDARMLSLALRDIDLSKYQVIFVENVGNLICPAGYSLGAEKKIVVVSVTEGPYMIRKHPLTIKRADLVVINKIDLQGVMGVDADALVRDVREIDANLPVFKVSAVTGDGLDRLIAGLGL
ncbi:MAG: hydrogenase nickel incorporation protein HypB [Candidatus Thorarchaeota archaeon]